MNGGEVIFHFKGDDKDLDKKTSNLSAKFSKMGGTIGKAFLKGTTVATTAMTGLIATSTKGFSEMEQLSGGAQKIFDEIDYSKIEKDAVKAYKNMNMSAQEYLKAINNVGATFASTMGDKKGYDTAKKGLQAISDYATGTGADINLLTEKYKMITRSTSSYLSIADQFAGLLPQTTKGFLEQAQASGYLSKKYKKLTEVPVEEYQQAITNMLEKGVDKMGLLGNTLAEAEKTINGSLLATKSAFSNFISGAGGIDEVISSMTNLGNNIAKAVTEMTPKLLTGFTKLISSFIPKIPQAIKTLIPPLFSALISLAQSIVGMVPSLIGILTKMLPPLLQEAITGITTILNSISAMLPVLIPQLVELMLELFMMLQSPENINLLAIAGRNLIYGLVAGIINSMPVLFSDTNRLLKVMVSVLSGGQYLLIKLGIALLKAFIKGFIESMPKNIKNACNNTINAIRNVFTSTSVTSILKNIGKFMVQGIWKGLNGNLGWFKNKIRGFVGNVTSFLKKTFKIGSPSKLMAKEVGQWLPKGIAVGIDTNTDSVNNAMKKLSKDTLNMTTGMFDLSPSLYGSASTNLSPQVNVTVNNNMETDPLGQMVNKIKTFAGGSKNDYNYGQGV